MLARTDKGSAEQQVRDVREFGGEGAGGGAGTGLTEQRSDWTGWQVGCLSLLTPDKAQSREVRPHGVWSGSERGRPTVCVRNTRNRNPSCSQVAWGTFLFGLHNAGAWLYTQLITHRWGQGEALQQK